jgi:hypothetical protein
VNCSLPGLHQDPRSGAGRHNIAGGRHRPAEDDSAQVPPLYLALSTHFSTGPIEKTL